MSASTQTSQSILSEAATESFRLRYQRGSLASSTNAFCPERRKCKGPMRSIVLEEFKALFKGASIAGKTPWRATRRAILVPCGHYTPKEAPEVLLGEVSAFLGE